MTFIKDRLKNIKALVFDVDGVLSDDTSPLGADGIPVRTTNTKDGFAIRNAINMGYKVAIITGGNAERVKLRYETLGVEHIYMGVGDKVDVLHEFAKETGIELNEMLYMGDDLIDFKVMELVGYPCCPQDACIEIKEISVYISEKIGGGGCVRDVIEQVMRAQNTWINKHSYTWRSA